MREITGEFSNKLILIRYIRTSSSVTKLKETNDLNVYVITIITVRVILVQ
jgi:hypothetical protein